MPKTHLTPKEVQLIISALGAVAQLSPLGQEVKATLKEVLQGGRTLVILNEQNMLDIQQAIAYHVDQLGGGVEEDTKEVSRIIEAAVER